LAFLSVLVLQGDPITRVSISFRFDAPGRSST